MGFMGFLAALVGASLTVGLLERTSLRRFRPPDDRRRRLRRPSPEEPKKCGGDQWRRRHVATDLGWYAITLAAAAIAAFVIRAPLEELAWGPLAETVGRWPFVGQAVGAIVVYDGVTYAIHVGMHRSDRLWEFHKVHHSSLHLDGLATTRTHMFEHLVRSIPAQAVVLAVGFPVAALGVALAVYAVAAVVGHANLDLPLRPVERVLVTPRLHHLHHLPATSDHNFATILVLWDRVFGTLERGEASPDERVGVPGERDAYPQRLADAAREPFRRVRRLHWSPPRSSGSSEDGRQSRRRRHRASALTSS